MKPVMQHCLSLATAFLLASCSSVIVSPPTPVPSPTPAFNLTTSPTLTTIPTSTRMETLTPIAIADELLDLRRLVSKDKLFAFLEDLTTLQAYSGWRNSATEGEAEALDYIAGTLGEFAFLQSLGLELERQTFHVFLATEIWESRLFLTIGGQENEVPADASRGHRYEIDKALRFDSDGALNDADRNPVEVSGSLVVIRSADEALNLKRDDVRGKIVFLDYSVIGPTVVGAGVGTQIVTTLIQKDIAGLVLVTDKTGASRGVYVGDGLALRDIGPQYNVPILYIRLEDLSQVGVTKWEDLAQIEAVRMIWDTDVFSPGRSGNLVAHVPGADSSQAMILGAHIDSADSPGAMDNGLSSAALLEVARVLDEGQIQPPVDLHLVWFGSEELGMYGSQYFVNTHQELLDRTLAAFLMDGITEDMPGPSLVIQECSNARFGDPRLIFAEYLARNAKSHQIAIAEVSDVQFYASDEGAFYGFTPHVGFAYGSQVGGFSHSPYDTLDTMQDLGDLMEQVASLALIAALETPLDAPDLRLTPPPQRRALILATHTEVLHMTPTMLVDFDRALAWEGFDVDVIPYGQSPTSEDLIDAGLILALPVIDYPTADSDLTLYDEAWSADEIDLLVDYVEKGGLLVLTNSANLLFFGRVFDLNEDWEKVNPLATPFGATYMGIPLSSTRARVTLDLPLTENLTSLIMLAENGLPISLQAGETLAEVKGQAALGLVDYGGAGGQVLILSDLGLLDLITMMPPERDNLTFLRNLARYARDR
jgi:hypothetical protein